MQINNKQMNESKKIIAAILLTAFIVIAGCIIADCSMADMTSARPLIFIALDHCNYIIKDGFTALLGSVKGL